MEGKQAEPRARANFVRKACLDHAEQLIGSADAVLATSDAPHNIAYHLAILALEEIGKAGMVGARAAVQGVRNVERMEKRFDDHVWKLMWAVWTPTISTGKLDPKEFDAAREFAASTHERRLRGLYVDPDAEEANSNPKDAVLLGHAASVLELARARLAYERAAGERDYLGENPELEWFLTMLNDDRGSRMLFSPQFVAKYEELQGETVDWVRWAKSEFEKVQREERDHLERELARARPDGDGKPKWIVRARIHTRSHSIRPKTLSVWNNAVERIKLTYVNKNNELAVEITLTDTVKAEEVFDVGLMYLKMVLVAMNIGSLGLFWHQFPEHVDRYYESIRDLDAPNLSLEASKENPYSGWKQEVLDEERMHRIVETLILLAPISNDDAQPIFSPYIHGLLTLCKSDLYLSLEKDARVAFEKSLRAGCKFFGDWDGNSDFVDALHVAFVQIVPDEAQRNTLFAPLKPDYSPLEGRFAEALNMKRLTDLYFVMVSHRNRRAALKAEA